MIRGEQTYFAYFNKDEPLFRGQKQELQIKVHAKANDRSKYFLTTIRPFLRLRL